MKRLIKSAIYLAFVLFSTGIFGQTLNVGTFNIKNDNPRDSLNAWKYRKGIVPALIKFHEFDLLGIQEAFSSQMKDLQDSLPEYAYVGKGRDDGQKKGEYSAIFYRRDKFKLINEGQFWLTQKDIHVPDKGWDAALPRICTWVELKDRQSGKKLFHFNTHFDHRGKVARVESAKLILQMIKEIAGKSPVILTGDFNLDQHSEIYKILNDSGMLEDAYVSALFKYDLNGTFNAFNSHAITKSRIDHVFLSSHFKVFKYGVLTDSYRNKAETEKAHSDNFPGEVHLYKAEPALPSDHFPVFVKTKY